jgi:hypothetical protein
VAMVEMQSRVDERGRHRIPFLIAALMTAR